MTTYLNSYLDNAYYCTAAGKYGGIYFTPNHAYSAIDTWCSMSATERANFDFNYDALDLLVDKDFGGEYGHKTQYDGTNANKVYSSTQPVDYQAQFVGYVDKQSQNVTEIKYTPKTGSEVTINTSTPWLTREAYEAIPNEKRHYAPITITAPGDYYMVNTPFMDGEVPYTTGQQIDTETYANLGNIKQRNIDVFTFTSGQTNTPTTEGDKEVYAPKTYYYCRSSYTINEKGEGKAVTTTAITMNNADVSSTTYNVNDANNPVQQGVVIDETTYDGLCNFQRGFTIHGTSPTEVSTLYVSNESDIHDLSAEKIITVIYLYEYDESDETGLNVTPVNERHIVNIHINFKSGVPEIGDIHKPDIVLPGTTLGMNIPSVTQGAYRVTESGWEIFSNSDDAATHYNGVPFVNNETPLYWYQNNYWIAYYAQTSLGKTYSKSVPLRVANYHDLKKVMDDKDHHYYIDHKDVERAPKIYINNYKTSDPTTSQNGLDLFKNLFNLSYLTEKATTGDLKDHELLNGRVRGGSNLEFFLRTDLDYTGETWESLGTNTGTADQCFGGVLHGDGHHISGLSSSLFTNLCGDIYNLGVSGPFTGAGIAEMGDGYVENCWIKSTSTEAKTTKPVFGSPTIAVNSPRPVRIVNSYYDEEDNVEVEKKYTNHNGNYGIPTRKTDRAFYNGEVTYDLNGFYLNKRYYEGTGNNEPAIPVDAKLTSGSQYVTDRYKDGDFVYANGTIPEEADRRLVVDENTGNPVLDGNGKLQYLPIWPTDYLFFGQTLNYGHVENVSHEDVPSAVDATNRVFRAPAYFGSKTMGVAHFNPNAIFAKTKKGDATVKAYEGMTAIDFTGCNDATYQQGWNGDKFYAPLLDDGGLTDFTNVDLTSNLLAYTDNTSTATAEATQTNTVVAGKLTDKAYAEVNTTYHTVAPVTDVIRGHWVQKVESNYVATRDHFLVDKEDFNSPIAYNFDSDHRMWYQRTPDNYVGRKKADGTGFIDNGAGWEGISLPFTAEIVTTNSKGEITHFYKSASGDASENDKGHEYWLRKYEGGALKTGSSNIFVATFNKPAAAGTEENKDYKNSFLWDYYYSHNTFNDLNSDDYPGTYYKPDPENDNIVKTYMHYPRLACATPYIIGFPGERYYEFDLSGNFEAKTAKATTPAKLSAQVITFVSPFGETIHVSDDEITTKAAAQNHDGYAFVTNFTARTLEGVAYVLNSDDTEVDKRGNSYKKVEDGALTVPFRPYFRPAAQQNPAPKRASSIVFSNETTQLQGNDNELNPDDKAYDLIITAKRKKIIVESHLREATEVRIVNATGITLDTFTIEPGETIETRVQNAGVYIVLTTDGRYLKKLALK